MAHSKRVQPPAAETLVAWARTPTQGTTRECSASLRPITARIRTKQNSQDSTRQSPHPPKRARGSSSPNRTLHARSFLPAENSEKVADSNENFQDTAGASVPTRRTGAATSPKQREGRGSLCGDPACRSAPCCGAVQILGLAGKPYAGIVRVDALSMWRRSNLQAYRRNFSLFSACGSIGAWNVLRTLFGINDLIAFLGRWRMERPANSVWNRQPSR